MTETIDKSLLSHVVKPAEMEWRKTKFDGVEMKPLYVDRDTGLLTALLRMAPGATLPDHEHVKVEQTYMLEGRLEVTVGVDDEARPEGSPVGRRRPAIRG